MESILRTRDYTGGVPATSLDNYGTDSHNISEFPYTANIDPILRKSSKSQGNEIKAERRMMIEHSEFVEDLDNEMMPETIPMIRENKDSWGGTAKSLSQLTKETLISPRSRSTLGKNYSSFDKEAETKKLGIHSELTGIFPPPKPSPYPRRIEQPQNQHTNQINTINAMNSMNTMNKSNPFAFSKITDITPKKDRPSNAINRSFAYNHPTAKSKTLFISFPFLFLYNFFISFIYCVCG